MNNLGDTNTWTVPNDTAAGSYSVYVWSTAQEGLMDETVEMIINHSGIRETKAVNVGNYHKNNAKWVYAGSYRFDGSGNESVTAMKVSNTERLAISGVKLVPCVSTRDVADFEGIAVYTAEETLGITKAMLEDGEYIQPLAPGDFTNVNVKVVGSHPQYEYIKINQTTATVNENKQIPVNASGETSVNLEIKLTGKQAKTYRLVLFKEYGTNTYTQRVAGSVSNLKLPVSADFSTASGKDAKYIASAGNEAGFAIKEGSVNIVHDGFYKILVWKPTFNYHINSADTATKLYASKNQPITINTGTKTVNSTIDWTGDNCEWVDLGNYLLNEDGIGTGYAVKFTGIDEAYTMLNEVKYLKLSSGVLIDNEFVTLKELDDKVIYTGGSSVNVTPYVNEGATVYVNGALAAAEATNVELSGELTGVTVRVEEGTDTKEYNFAVVKNASVINWDDASVTVTNDGATEEEGTTGYNGSSVAMMTDDSATYPVSGAVGSTKVYVYGVPVHTGTLEELEMGGAYSVTVKARGSESTQNISAPTAEGWIEIGTYNFAGSGDEYVKITVDSSNIMYLNCIKLENSVGELYVTDPIVENADLKITAPANGNTSAWVYALNKSGTGENVTVLLAVYDKETDKLVSPVSIKTLPVTNSVVKISTDAVAVAESENVYIKAFVWNGTGSIKPLKPVCTVGSGN